MATSADIRSQLVAALHSDLIGPGWDDVARRHEQLPQPPSVWFTTGFLVPHVFQQEAGRTTTDEQLSFSDLAGEEPSSDATHRLEKQEKDDDANDALDQANTRRSWFTSSCGLSFILERGSTIEATVSWGDYTAPADGDDDCRRGHQPIHPIGGQPSGSLPALDRSRCLNIRPFLSAQLRKGGKAGAGILRAKPGTIKWAKDKGKEPMRSMEDFPWCWGWDDSNRALEKDFGAPIPGAPSAGASFDGNRWNDLHYTRAAKEAARARHRGEG